MYREGYFIVKDGEVLIKYPPTFDNQLLKRWIELEGGKFDPMERKHNLNCGNGITINLYDPKNPELSLPHPLMSGEVKLIVVDTYVRAVLNPKEPTVEKAKELAKRALKARVKKPAINIKGVVLNFEEFEELETKAVQLFSVLPNRTLFFKNKLQFSSQDLDLLNNPEVDAYREKVIRLNQVLDQIDRATDFQQVKEIYDQETNS